MPAPRVFLLSPAHCGGKRAGYLMAPRAAFPLAERLRREGITLGEAFSFLSGLYFRGKLTYARRFARPPAGEPGVLVITSNRGMLPAETVVGLEDLRAFGAVDIAADDPLYRAPMARDAARVAALADRTVEAVLLGSIATKRYTDVLLEALGERLLFPRDFVGRGDMSRGALLLRAARDGRELDYMTHEDPAMTAATTRRRPARVRIPATASATLKLGGHAVELTNLDKVFFPERGHTKRDLLQYYADVSRWLLPHLEDRGITMKRYPNGIHGKCFFMKRTPESAPDWIETCEVMHKSASLIAFPLAQDLASLLWLVNLGCIDLNQWYARCDDVDRPDCLNFDLDPGEGASFAKVRETALLVRAELEALGMRPLAKTSGSSGIHVYVPIARGPVQKEVWTFAKAFAKRLDREHPKLVTAEYRIADRPRGRVLVDYNQNAWGRTLASVYSVRPVEAATVSTPVTWEEIEDGVEVGDFTMQNVPARLARVGDLFKPLLAARGRFRLETLA